MLMLLTGIAVFPRKTKQELSSKTITLGLEQIMRNGADVNAKDSSGKTALHYAAANGNVEIVKLLMDYKARPDDVDSTGNSALHLAWAPDVSFVLAFPPFTGDAKEEEPWSDSHVSCIVFW